MNTTVFASASESFLVLSSEQLRIDDIDKLEWLLGASVVDAGTLDGTYVGPRSEMISPWSTNAAEIAENVGVSSRVERIERFRKIPEGEFPVFDPMLEAVYEGLHGESLRQAVEPEPVRSISDLDAYNSREGLALTPEEIAFLKDSADRLGRELTDCEVYGFAQINSEHCRHKIFNGTFSVDGETKPSSLFDLIKETSKAAPDNLVSAYKDNVAFIRGPKLSQFAPSRPEHPERFELRAADSVLSLKAETHNFPTTVEPFNGASTGSGGEIRDRMAGGTGSFPLAGTAVYMTSYPRLQGSLAVEWEKFYKERDWKYQTPSQILLKASNGASDFGNKFGQPLITGSVLTLEARTPRGLYAFDRAVMLAGGIGYAHAEHAQKKAPRVGDKVVLLGGDNYRIGMAGGSVSSVDTGVLSRSLELSAVQRANPEMQKRVYNVIRALAERADNPIVMIHDHGAGGHINCFSELLEAEGGVIDIDKLPVGDRSLSIKEIICNESQERMGLIVSAEDVPLLEQIAERERAPLYVVGEITGERRIVFRAPDGSRPVDLPVEVLFGSSPRTVLEDRTDTALFPPLEYGIESGDALLAAVKKVLSLEAVACKDWLTNKVDRSVSGLVAQQQCVGPFQLPLADVGVMALDYSGTVGAATALGHAPGAGLIDERAGSILGVAEALTNIVWAPLEGGLDAVVLSANWMWPARQPGEDARLYRGVEALSLFCRALEIAVPTGKDSLSMTMKYDDGSVVRAPGTVVVSAAGSCSDVRAVVTPDLKPVQESALLHVDLSSLRDAPLGGSSFAQSLGQLGSEAPTVADAGRFRAGFNYLQDLIRQGKILAGHDVSSGGVIAAVCEMSFAGDIGVDLVVPGSELDVVPKLFCEKPGVVLQVERSLVKEITDGFSSLRLAVTRLGDAKGTQIRLHAGRLSFSTSVSELRRVWVKPSYLLDSRQTVASLAKERFETFDAHPLKYTFPAGFDGSLAAHGIDRSGAKRAGVTAAILRDKGTNGDRELAYCLYAAGFDVLDITTFDLMDGRASLDDVQLIAFPGGFSNSDVLGAGRGWAGVFRYNERAMCTLNSFLERPDTLSLGVCNGCQFMVAFDMLYPEHHRKMAMLQNDSSKFESCFVNVRVEETASVFLRPLIGSRLGIWVAHGEGRFSLPEGEAAYDIPLRFVSADYPANPNGSDFNAAAVSSRDGRHLAIMPHLERSMFSWNWPYRGAGEVPSFAVSPWILAFTAAREWLEAARAARAAE